MNDNPAILPGLLSVTFRALPAAQIVRLAAQAKLSAIEWGADVHVPPGNTADAQQARHMCADHGLAVSAYGSYLRAGATAPNSATIDAVLDTAAELGTKLVRVWAGTCGSAQADESARAAVADDLSHWCTLAQQHGLIIATEYHAQTLTDDIDSCLRLIVAVNHPNLRSFWQPPNGMPPHNALQTLQRVRPHLANLHVFHWWPDAQHRLPLSAGADRWPTYLHEAAQQSNEDQIQRYASLEFVPNDSIEQFHADAQTLHDWLNQIERKLS